MRTVFRNPLAIRAFRWIHPDIATSLAHRWSGTSRNMRPRDGGEALRRVALERLRAEPSLELYVYGHTHASAAGRAEGGGVYANPGAWMDEPTFLRVTPERLDLARLVGGAVSVTKSLERSHSR
jgi:hypothetical protein